MQWKDVTSYQRDGERIPTSWEVKAGAFRVVVTRYIYGEPDRWYLTAHPLLEFLQLSPSNIEDAKHEAVQRVLYELRRAVSALSVEP